jgi:hypothetical protein
MDDAQGYSSVDDAINRTAAIAGMDPAHWRAVAQIESGVNPFSNMRNATQFKGLYQLGHGVWHDHGQGDIYNPMDNAMAAARYAQANAAEFRAHFGRDPTPIETYMMHQQGAGFYTKGQMSNIAGNPFEKNMKASLQTPQSFEEGWRRNMEDKVARMGGQAMAPFQSVAGTRGMSPSGGYATAQPGQPGAVAEAESTDQTEDGTQQPQGPDVAGQMKDIQDRIAQQEQANAPPSLPPMAPIQPMMTPAMMRARMLSQAMMNRTLGLTPPSPPEQAT